MPLEYDFVLTNVLSRILQNDKLLCVHFILISKSTDDQGILKTKFVIPREEGELILPNSSCFLPINPNPVNLLQIRVKTQLRT